MLVIEEEKAEEKEEEEKDDGVCDPKGSRKAKCTKLWIENQGTKGPSSCTNDCDCAGGRWCSLFGWC